MSTQVNGEKLAWGKGEWLRELQILGNTSYAALPEDKKPTRFLLGKKLVIIESPAAWIRRIQESGGVPKLRGGRETDVETLRAAAQHAAQAKRRKRKTEEDAE